MKLLLVSTCEDSMCLQDHRRFEEIGDMIFLLPASKHLPTSLDHAG